MLQWVVAVIAFDVGSNDSAPPIPTQTDSTAPSGPNVCNLMTQTVKASNSPFLPAGTLAKTDRTPLKILQGLLCVVGAYFLCALSVLTVRKIVSVPPEVSRKLLHLSAIIVLTVWLYAFTDWRITEITIVLFAIAAHPILLFLLSIKNRSIKE